MVEVREEDVNKKVAALSNYKTNSDK